MTAGRGVRQHDGHLPAIDGLRALAVVAVLAFHGGVPFASGGFLGVSLFFTISGFIITTLLLNDHERSGRISLRAFWERRYRRLMPAALVTIAGIAIAAPHFADPVQRHHLRGDLVGALAYVANWHFLARGTSYADLFGGPSPVLHFWSLAIEEQFYLVFPLLVAGVFALTKGSRRALAVVLVVLTSASLLLQVAMHDVDRVYFGTDTRAAELLAGALLAIALARPRAPTARWSFIGAGSLVVFCALVGTSTASASWLGDGGLAIVALLNVALVGAAARGAGAFRFLASRPFVAVGRVSYGLYLFHWPAFIWLNEQRTGLHGPALAVARVSVVAGLAVVSYHFLECPVRYTRVLRRPRSFVPAAATAMVVCVALTLTGSVSGATPTSRLLDPSVMPTSVPPVRIARKYVPPKRSLRVMVVGNEMGNVAAWTLATLPGHPFTVDNATREQCPIVGVRWTRRNAIDRPYFAESCADWPYRWVAEARVFHPDVVLVFSNAEESELGDTQARFVDVSFPPLYTKMVDSYTAAASVLRSTGAIVEWASVPQTETASPSGAVAGTTPARRAELMNSASAIVSHRELGVVSLDFASLRKHPVPPRQIARWFEREVRRAYRAGYAELGLPTKNDRQHARRILVTGDSTSLNIAAGLADHGLARNDVVVDWAGEIGCPLVRVGRFRHLGDDESSPTTDCKPFDQLWFKHYAMFKPQLVLVMSSFMDASDMQRFGSATWEHLCQPAFDQFVLSEFERAYKVARRFHAQVAWATAPLEDAATGSTNELRGRLHCYNAVLQQLATHHRDVFVVPFAAHVDRSDGAVDRSQRPDGVHFTVAAGLAIADQWLASALLSDLRSHSS